MTIARLKNFRDSIRNIARSNRFTVTIENPWKGVRGYEIYDKNEMIYHSYSASIPQFDVVGPTIKYRGTNTTISGDYKREPLTVTFINDDRWQARAFFEDWIRSFVNYDDSNERRSMDKQRFGSLLTITQYGNSEDNIVAKYQYKDSVPLKLTNIELDHGNQNSIETFKIDFYYSEWVRVTTDNAVSRTDEDFSESLRTDVSSSKNNINYTGSDEYVTDYEKVKVNEIGPSGNRHPTKTWNIG